MTKQDAQDLLSPAPMMIHRRLDAACMRCLGAFASQQVSAHGPHIRQQTRKQLMARIADTRSSRLRVECRLLLAVARADCYRNSMRERGRL
jgi:hypothetical protein